MIYPGNAIESQRFEDVGDRLAQTIGDAVSQQANVIPVILASGNRAQAFVNDLRHRSDIVANTRVANLTFMRATGVQVFPSTDSGAQAALFVTKENLMSPLADVLNEIIHTLGGNRIEYRQKEGKRFRLGTHLVGFGGNPFGSGQNTQAQLDT